MAISTYTELRTAVANWLDRSDLTDRIPEFITLAEEYFNHKLRVRQMESTTTDTMSSSAITLPSDFQGFRSIYLSTSPKYSLQYYTPEQQAVLDQGDSGRPYGYSITGTTVTFFPTADSDYDVGYTYYKSIPPLASNSTNWLLTAAPGAYLHGACMQAWVYLLNEQDAAKEKALMDASLSNLKTSDANDRWSGSTLKMRAS
jgi:hypothetical protein